LDIQVGDRAEDQISKFIDRRSKQRNRARAEEMAWKKDVARYHEERREANRLEWIAHYEGLARSHTKLAVGYARKVFELEEERSTK
jgi:hypothetical protein